MERALRIIQQALNTRVQASVIEHTEIQQAWEIITKFVAENKKNGDDAIPVSGAVQES
jgi:hypothetical protein